MDTSLPKPEDMVELLQLDKFKKWVASKPPTSILGYTNGSTSCPLARYIKESFVVNYAVTVWSGGAVLTNPAGYSRKYEFPVWASAFIILLDGNRGGKIGESVAYGMKILDDVDKILQEKRDDVDKKIEIPKGKDNLGEMGISTVGEG